MFGCFFDARQVDAEGCAHVDLRVHVNDPTCLPDGTEHHCESKAGATSFALGGKKWLEDALPHLLAHAVSAVAHDDPNEISGSHVWMRVAERKVDLAIRSFDTQPTAVWHCVTRIHTEIDQKLLKLSGINPDRAELCGKRRGEFDILTNDAGQHLAQVSDQLIDIDDSGLDQLPSREGQQLSR